MAKTKISQFDATASNNTDINSVNVAEGCPPSGINNAIREMASLLKKQEVGTDAMTSPDIDGGTIDGATIGGSSGVTIGVSDGTVSAPSIKFTSDTNTGIYRGGTDILKFVTAGTDAITIDASQRLGIGTGSPAQLLHLSSSDPRINIEDTDAGGIFQIRNTSGIGYVGTLGTHPMIFYTNGIERMRLESDGDISFYEDTGTTPKFFWDASAEALGIGTASPSYRLDVTGAVGISGTDTTLLTVSGVATGYVAEITNVSGAAGARDGLKVETLLSNSTTKILTAASNSTDRFVVTGDGNVGIGGVPNNWGGMNRTLELIGSSDVQLAIHANSDSLSDEDRIGEVAFLAGTTNTLPNVAAIIGRVAGAAEAKGFLTFHCRDTDTAGAPQERMRITKDGNLLVGTTDESPYNNNAGSSADNGISLRGSIGKIEVARYNSVPFEANRTGSDGDILSFRKDGITEGAIAVAADQLKIFGTKSSNNCGIGFFSNNTIRPLGNNGNQVDDEVDVGDASWRFDDIRATNGTIQTSDQNEKNTITDSDLGIDFIKRLTPKSYIFNGKTRTHYGLIAQDVETVLGDISKPTSGFAGFIKDDISEEQDGSEYRYGLRYTEFVAPLIQAVKDQQATIDALTARITALEKGE